MTDVLLVGPENSGKSCIIETLQQAADDLRKPKTYPTVGFSVHHLDMFRHHFTIFDMSGKERYHRLWEEYYSQAHALIFVFDCHNLEMLPVARDLLAMILNHRDMVSSSTPMIILGNKKDLTEKTSIENYSEFLRLHRIAESRPFFFEFCTVKKPNEIKKCLEWLCEHLDKKLY